MTVAGEVTVQVGMPEKLERVFDGRARNRGTHGGRDGLMS